MNPRYRTVAAGLVVLAAIIGIYWFQSSERKAAVPMPGAALTQAGVSKALAKGALAAFIVKPQREPVADIVFQDGGGKQMNLGQWRGRVVLVNLWATWCVPCRKEMPALAELQKQLGSKDFEVVAISIDRKGAEASAAFIAETGSRALRLYVEPSGKILDDLEALGLPATVLIDRQGNEIGRLLGPAEWASPEAFELIRAAIAEGTSS
jgi:thiol-disulfide isomerase/thioredoxin